MGHSTSPSILNYRDFVALVNDYQSFATGIPLTLYKGVLDCFQSSMAENGSQQTLGLDCETELKNGA